jgi:hypothetical protein
MARSDSDPAAVYTVSQNGAVVSTITIDQTSGAFRWQAIYSSMSIAAGDVVAVKLTASGSGCARADTIKFVRVS